MITFGMIASGPHENVATSLHREIPSDGMIADELRGESPAVNVIICLSGQLLNPDFEGCRRGAFSRKDKMLGVQVAISDEVSESNDVDYIRAEMGAAIIDALNFAVVEFKKKRIDYDPTLDVERIRRWSRGELTRAAEEANRECG